MRRAPPWSECANTAVFELTYSNDEYGDFEGITEFTVQLSDGTEDMRTIDDVLLVDGEEAGWVLEDPAE